MQKNETLQEAWYEMCMNTEHPNSLICPDPGTDLFFPVDNDPRQEECCSARQYTQELRSVRGFMHSKILMMVIFTGS